MRDPWQGEPMGISTMLGHEKMGTGPRAVIVLNDWMGDTSTWDAGRVYLDSSKFTWVFADLRGYGRSRGRTGRFTVEEAAADVVELADASGFQHFAIVGHSMSSLVALHLAQHVPDRVDGVVVITPPPPTGFGVDDATLAALQAVGRGDDVLRMNGLRRMIGDRLSESFLKRKVEHWRASSDPEAVAGYVAMYARRGLPQPSKKIAKAVLAVTGEQDSDVMRGDAVEKWLAPLCERLVLERFADCGHYPMQETPPLLVAVIERFLSG
jgi:3-oxoadipate enol-lactonase